MTLSPSEIISAACGIVRAEQNELGIELHRFTREQEAFFHKTHDLYCRESFFNGYFSRNCRTGAGISLDFVCDAERLSFTFGTTEYAKLLTERVHMLDLLVDGVLACSYPAGEDIVFEATGEKHRYSLIFPAYARPTVSAVTLAGATEFTPCKREAEILFLGDSITQGAWAEHPSDSYVMRTARALGVGIINQGNSGFVYDVGSLAQVCDPRVIVTAYGINDFMRKTPERITRDTTEYLKRLRELYKNAKIVSVMPLWTVWDGDDPNFKHAERAALAAVYERYSDLVVDGHAMMPHDKALLADEVHPNACGFAHYGDRLAGILKTILQ